jgi:hypothetical protein
VVAKSQVQASLAVSSSAQEQTFYTEMNLKLSTISTLMDTWQSGVRSLEEDTLLLLRGLAAPARPTEYALRLEAAKTAHDASEMASIMAEWDLSKLLQAKLEEPFLKDNSQDAEAEDDEQSHN